MEIKCFNETKDTYIIFALSVRDRHWPLCKHFVRTKTDCDRPDSIITQETTGFILCKYKTFVSGEETTACQPLYVNMQGKKFWSPTAIGSRGLADITAEIRDKLRRGELVEPVRPVLA